MSAFPRPPFRLRYRTLVILMALLVILWSGVSYWMEYTENAAQRARELLAPPLSVTCNVELEGGKSFHGKILEQSERWIVLEPPPNTESKSRRTWIPRERILFIKMDE